MPTLKTRFATYVCAMFVAAAASAQDSPTQSKDQAALDEHGNVTRRGQEPRAVGLILRDDPRPDRLGGIDMLSKWREATAPDALGPMPASGQSFASAPGLGLAPMSSTTAAMKKLFTQYGGFRASDTPEPASPELTLARRRELIAASRSTTPIRRALLNRTQPAGVGASVPVMPGPLPTTETIQGQAEAGASLEAKLQQLTQEYRNRASLEGWERFHSGRFRSAARAFASAIELDPLDAESRIGELVCMIQLGSLRTAASALEGIVEHSSNPFKSTINLSERFGSAAQANELRGRARILSQVEGGEAPLLAVHIIALWFLGEQEEALRGANLLKTRFPGSEYSSWPNKMREATQKHP